MKEKFIEFLKRENVYERFVENFSLYRKGYTMEAFFKANEEDPQDFVSSAFIWVKDDILFWDNIDQKWQEELS